MIIRVLLIIGILTLIVWILGRRNTIRGQAWLKLLTILLLIFAIITVAFPGTTNSIAHFVGVGRGADLLLYVVTLAFLYSLLIQYMHRQDENEKIVRLSRRLAIEEANRSEHNAKVIRKIKT